MIFEGVVMQQRIDYINKIYLTCWRAKPCGATVYKCFPPAIIEGLERKKWSCDLWWFYIINYNYLLEYHTAPMLKWDSQTRMMDG
jgi:hypothetical protein